MMVTVYQIKKVQGKDLILRRVGISYLLVKGTGLNSLSKSLGIKSDYDAPIILIEDKKMKQIKEFAFGRVSE